VSRISTSDVDTELKSSLALSVKLSFFIVLDLLNVLPEFYYACSLLYMFFSLNLHCRRKSVVLLSSVFEQHCDVHLTG
jgi:hypothetical protein